MRPTYSRAGHARKALIFCAAAAAFFGLSSIAGRADPFEQAAPFLMPEEIRLGAFAANLEEGGGEHAEMVINGELLFGRPERAYGNPILDHFLRPRPHIGFSVAPDAGVSQVYAGVTWDLKLTGGLFFETSFGGALHDGPTASDDPDSYGCSLLFRESASLGYAITERTRLLLTVDHISNASLCDENQGLTNAGVRLAHRW
jgi:lipid A 3-O-deacylase